MTPQLDYLTTGQLARRYDVPTWLVREILDRLGGSVRVGLYRLWPVARLDALEVELRRRGRLPEVAHV
jgi:hypothetical protein